MLWCCIVTREISAQQMLRCSLSIHMQEHCGEISVNKQHVKTRSHGVNGNKFSLNFYDDIFFLLFILLLK